MSGRGMSPGVGVEAVLIRILSDTAGLEDAACRGRGELFEPRDHNRAETREQAHERHERAAWICTTCPVLDACTTWSKGEPEHGAVVAGRVPPPEWTRDSRRWPA